MGPVSSLVSCPQPLVDVVRLSGLSRVWVCLGANLVVRALSLVASHRSKGVVEDHRQDKCHLECQARTYLLALLAKVDLVVSLDPKPRSTHR